MRSSVRSGRPGDRLRRWPRRARPRRRARRSTGRSRGGLRPAVVRGSRRPRRGRSLPDRAPIGQVRRPRCRSLWAEAGHSSPSTEPPDEQCCRGQGDRVGDPIPPAGTSGGTGTAAGPTASRTRRRRVEAVDPRRSRRAGSPSRRSRGPARGLHRRRAPSASELAVMQAVAAGRPPVQRRRSRRPHRRRAILDARRSPRLRCGEPPHRAVGGDRAVVPRRSPTSRSRTTRPRRAWRSRRIRTQNTILAATPAQLRPRRPRRSSPRAARGRRVPPVALRHHRRLAASSAPGFELGTVMGLHLGWPRRSRCAALLGVRHAAASAG